MTPAALLAVREAIPASCQSSGCSKPGCTLPVARSLRPFVLVDLDAEGSPAGPREARSDFLFFGAVEDPEAAIRAYRTQEGEPDSLRGWRSVAGGIGHRRPGSPTGCRRPLPAGPGVWRRPAEGPATPAEGAADSLPRLHGNPATAPVRGIAGRRVPAGEPRSGFRMAEPDITLKQGRPALPAHPQRVWQRPRSMRGNSTESKPEAVARRRNSSNADAAIDRTSHPTTPLSTGPPASRRRYRPDSPDRSPLSTGAAPGDPSYRPELSRQIPVIDRSCPGRPQLSTGALPADPRYRPELPRQIPVIDRSCPGRSPLSTGAAPADPRYRPELPRQIPVIDRSCPGRFPLSTGAPSAGPVTGRTSRPPMRLPTGPPVNGIRFDGSAHPDVCRRAVSLRYGAAMPV